MSISRFLKNMTVAVGVAAASLAATTSAHAVSLSEITARGKVKIGVLTGAPPMGMVDEKGNPSGYDVDVANLIGSYLSLPVELVPLTPPARIPALQTGKVDFLVATLAPTGERAKTVMFTQPYSALSRARIRSSKTSKASRASEFRSIAAPRRKPRCARPMSKVSKSSFTKTIPPAHRHCLPVRWMLSPCRPRLAKRSSSSARKPVCRLVSPSSSRVIRWRPSLRISSCASG